MQPLGARDAGDGFGEMVTPIDVVLVTCQDFPDLPEDERPVAEALRGRGLQVAAVAWDDPEFDWASARLVCVRASWDYSTRHAEFLRWIAKVDSATELWNPASVMVWNAHKSYLIDLSEAGINVADTVAIARGERCDLRELIGGRGWKDAVVKPAVSGTGRETIRLSQHEPDAAQAHFDRLAAVEDVLVQEFVTSVETEGELSLNFIDGEFSHAVRKRAKAGDFRVLEEWGGNTVPEEHSRDALEFAVKAIAQSPAATLYGRVDLLRGNDGEWQLAELELVEPELYFRHAPSDAPGRMADAIVARLQSA